MVSFLAGTEVLLVAHIGQLGNHNFLALCAAENAITMESIMMPAGEQAI